MTWHTSACPLKDIAKCPRCLARTKPRPPLESEDPQCKNYTCASCGYFWTVPPSGLVDELVESLTSGELFSISEPAILISEAAFDEAIKELKKLTPESLGAFVRPLKSLLLSTSKTE